MATTRKTNGVNKPTRGAGAAHSKEKPIPMVPIGVNHPTYCLLVKTINKIKSDNFPDSRSNRRAVQRFKNEDQQFPWTELEGEIVDLFQSVEGMGCAAGEEVFEEREFDAFVGFIEKHTVNDLLDEKVRMYEWFNGSH